MPLRRSPILALLTLTVAAVGCHPTQPFYVGRDGDLEHYLASATAIEYPDLHREPLPEVNAAPPPITLSNLEFQEMWDITLEHCVAIGLRNSEVIRRDGLVTTPGFEDTVLSRPEAVGTVYDTAIVESDPFNGVEGALSEFDAEFSTSLFWEKTDRPQNSRTPGGGGVVVFPSVLTQDQAVFSTELSKRSATGSQFFLRNITSYDDGNALGDFRALPSAWTTEMEMEMRHPLLRGSGAMVNRIPIVLARINADVSLTDFEINVRNFVSEIENAYWDLACAYRNVETSQEARDSALETWRRAQALKGESGGAQEVAQAGGQYFEFRAALERSLRDLLQIEGKLRFLLGIAHTDGRMLRPIDDLETARVEFDWHEIHCEALVRSPEIRRVKWGVKRREMELIAARNQVLPQVNLVALYRFLGSGDELFGDGPAFPNAGSSAVDELLDGKYQEVQLGVEFGMKPGLRREMAGVRHAQLQLAREHARLEELELAVSHNLSQAVRDLDFHHQVAQTQFNRLSAAENEIEILETAQGEVQLGGRTPTDLLLEAQRRRAFARAAYYQALCDYNKAVKQVHFRKGSLLEYNSVQLAEGRWPKKAYHDALNQARRRAAAPYVNYAAQEPRIVSAGPVEQFVHPAVETPVPLAPLPAEAIGREEIPAPRPTPPAQSWNPPGRTEPPTPAAPSPNTQRNRENAEFDFSPSPPRASAAHAPPTAEPVLYAEGPVGTAVRTPQENRLREAVPRHREPLRAPPAPFDPWGNSDSHGGDLNSP